jgi:hypothetical protein
VACRVSPRLGDWFGKIKATRNLPAVGSVIRTGRNRYSHTVTVGSSSAAWGAVAARCEPLPCRVASTAGRHYNSKLKPASVDIEGSVERLLLISEGAISATSAAAVLITERISDGYD